MQNEANSIPNDYDDVEYSNPAQLDGIRHVDFYFSGVGFRPEPRGKYTPGTILTSGSLQGKDSGGTISSESTHFVPEPYYGGDFLFGYGWRMDPFDYQDGLRCAFDE